MDNGQNGKEYRVKKSCFFSSELTLHSGIPAPCPLTLDLLPFTNHTSVIADRSIFMATTGQGTAAGFLEGFASFLPGKPCDAERSEEIEPRDAEQRV